VTISRKPADHHRNCPNPEPQTPQGIHRRGARRFAFAGLRFWRCAAGPVKATGEGARFYIQFGERTLNEHEFEFEFEFDCVGTPNHQTPQGIHRRGARRFAFAGLRFWRCAAGPVKATGEDARFYIQFGERRTANGER
jgi:hypothetical protein